MHPLAFIFPLLGRRKCRVHCLPCGILHESNMAKGGCYCFLPNFWLGSSGRVSSFLQSGCYPWAVSGPCSEQGEWGRQSEERGTPAGSLQLFLFIEATWTFTELPSANLLIPCIKKCHMVTLLWNVAGGGDKWRLAGTPTGPTQVLSNSSDSCFGTWNPTLKVPSTIYLKKIVFQAKETNNWTF